MIAGSQMPETFALNAPLTRRRGLAIGRLSISRPTN